MPKKNIMDEFEIHEISGVDRPCQEPALTALIKKAPEESGTLADQASDSQPNPNPTMTENQISQEDFDAAVAKAEALEAELAVAKAVGELTDVERAFYGELTEADQTDFLAKSAEERTAQIEASQEEDPVVFKSLDGTVFRKSDDARMIALAKSNDELTKQLRKAAADKVDAELTKAAEELDHLTGDVATKKSLLRAISTLPEAEQKAAMEMLVAKNASGAPAFETAGVEGDEAEGTYKDIDEMAKAYAAKNDVSLPNAYDAVMKTPEGAALYQKTI